MEIIGFLHVAANIAA